MVEKVLWIIVTVVRVTLAVAIHETLYVVFDYLQLGSR